MAILCNIRYHSDGNQPQLLNRTVNFRGANGDVPIRELESKKPSVGRGVILPAGRNSHVPDPLYLQNERAPVDFVWATVTNFFRQTRFCDAPQIQLCDDYSEPGVGTGGEGLATSSAALERVLLSSAQPFSLHRSLHAANPSEESLLQPNTLEIIDTL